MGVALALTLLAVGAPLAAADRNVVRDGADGGSVDPANDIRKAVAAHAREGRLRHVIKVAEAGPQTLAFATLEIRAGGRRYYASDEGMFRCCRGKRTGNVRAKTRRNRVVLRFRRRAIGSPDRYRWRVYTGGEVLEDTDRAPDRGWARHEL